MLTRRARDPELVGCRDPPELGEAAGGPAHSSTGARPSEVGFDWPTTRRARRGSTQQPFL